MRTLLSLILPVFLALTPMSAGAQQRPDLTRFKAFADPLVGSWEVKIRDLDEKGKLTWESDQKRTFSYVLANEFLEERTTAKTPGSALEVTIGLHLLSYDPKRNLLIQQGFWPGQAGTLFTVEASLANDNRSADGHISMPQEQDFRNRRRIEIKWLSPREFSLKTFGKDSEGREFVNEELVYRRLG